MSSKHHHKGLHHNYHTTTAMNDSAGWVEGISALRDSHPATALMLAEPPAVQPATTAADTPSTPGVTPSAQPTAGTATAVVTPVVAAASDAEGFAACLDHSLALMEIEVSTWGTRGPGVGASLMGQPFRKQQAAESSWQHASIEVNNCPQIQQGMLPLDIWAKQIAQC